MSSRIFPLLASTLSLLLLVTATTASAQSRAYRLDFEEDFLLDPPEGPASNGDPRPLLRYDEGGVIKTRELTIDRGTPYRAWLQSEVSPMADATDCAPVCGDHRGALSFHISNQGNDDPTRMKEKVLLPLTDPTDVQATEIPVWSPTRVMRYVSFDFMLDNNYQTSLVGTFVLHLQLGQSSGGHPVFTMETQKNGAGVDLVFFYSNDETEEAFYCGAGDYHKEFHRISNVNLGEWKKVVFQFVPPYGGTDPAQRQPNPGWIGVDYGNTGKFVTTGGAHWGYRANPTRAPYTNLDPTCTYVNRSLPEMKGTIGIYRAAQPRLQTVSFDNVTWGSKLAAVNGG